jgi:NDP-sugar pyrophosphorylase family protein
MQTIILATDEQRVLPPLTDAAPAPLLSVVDRPVMATTVEVLARAGQKRLLVSLCNRGGPIAAHFGSGSRWGVDIKYLTQREAWGSAGALKWAGRLLNETFLVLPGDAIIDLDIEAALAYHQSHGGVATVILHAPASSALSEGGPVPMLEVTPDGRVLALGTVAADTRSFAAIGAFIFEPSVLNTIPERHQFDTISQLVPALIAAGEPVYGYEMAGYWNPLATIGDYHEAQQVYLYSAYRQSAPEQADHAPVQQVRFPSLDGRQVAPGVWVGLNHSIHPTVKVSAPVYIGEGSWIGREVELGAGTIIGANVVIDEEATISNSAILSETYVGQLVKIEQRVVNITTIMDPESGECIRVVDPFLLTRVGASSGEPNRAQQFFSGIGAFLFLAMLSPLILLLLLAAFITAGGRPIRKTEVVGQRLNSLEEIPKLYHFQLLHFQTRRSNGAYTLIGRWMEQWELYRLPELLNVLRGDMALVGVKPLQSIEADHLSELWQQKRHDIPAGFTGLWYMQTDVTSDLDAVLVVDVYYTATRTWHGDLLLLLRTPYQWFRRCVRHDLQSSDPEVLVHTDKVRST